jgi:hypothetical protein
MGHTAKNRSSKVESRFAIEVATRSNLVADPVTSGSGGLLLTADTGSGSGGALIAADAGSSSGGALMTADAGSRDGTVR